MRTNHANGNWTVVEDIVYVNPLSDDPCRNIPIATVRAYFGSPKTEFNAQLIASAPDLFEVANDYISYFETCCMTKEKQIMDNVSQKRVDLYYKSKKAIQKAITI